MKKRGTHLWRIFWITGASISALRIGALAILVVLASQGRESISTVPLILLLLPEGWLFPREMVWTPMSFALVSLTLAAGSFIVALIVTVSYGLVAHRRVTK